MNNKSNLLEWVVDIDEKSNWYRSSVFDKTNWPFYPFDKCDF